MNNAMAWCLFALGVGHIAYGLIAFKTPFLDAVRAGFIGKFSAPENRRTTFWFLVFGPLLMLAGHTAIHAVATNDIPLLKVVGAYALVTSLIGIAAFPKSPFIAAVLVSVLLNASVYGFL